MAGFSEINKRGDSNKACSWENVLKKNKKNSMLIEFPMLENLFQRGGFIAFRLRTVVTIWGIQI